MKRPAFQFYPGDWLHDTGLRACSLAARGLWIDMLSHMHQGRPYGHLTLPRTQGEAAKAMPQPIVPSVLARMVGSDEPEVTQLLAELDSFGAFSRSGRGTIFSRRMVKDEKVRKLRAAGGYESLRNLNVPRPKNEAQTSMRPTVMALTGSPSSSISSIKRSNVPSVPVDTRLILERLELPLLRSNVQAVIASIESISRKNGTSLVEAATWLRNRAFQAKTDGQQVNSFWFQDAKYNSVTANAPIKAQVTLHDPDANCPKCRGTGSYPSRAHPGREIRCHCVEEAKEAG